MAADTPCELYLCLRSERLTGAADALRALLSAEPRIACVRAIGPFPDLSPLREAVAICHSAGRPLIVADGAEAAVETCAALGADGVHLRHEPGLVPRIRDALGAEAILGIAVRDSRHEALLAAEAGADYLSFAPSWPADGSAPDILHWWAAMIETPMVVENADTSERLGAVAPLAEFVTVYGDDPASFARAAQNALACL